jgi:hypothetical protein
LRLEYGKGQHEEWVWYHVTPADAETLRAVLAGLEELDGETLAEALHRKGKDAR